MARGAVRPLAPIGPIRQALTHRARTLDPSRRILQSWRTDEFGSAPDSQLELTFEPDAGGTRLTLRHTGIPEGQGPVCEEGWIKNYFEPMKSFFGGSVAAEKPAAAAAPAMPAPKAKAVKPRTAAARKRPAAKKKKAARKPASRTAPKRTAGKRATAKKTAKRPVRKAARKAPARRTAGKRAAGKRATAKRGTAKKKTATRGKARRGARKTRR